VIEATSRSRVIAALKFSEANRRAATDARSRVVERVGGAHGPALSGTTDIPTNRDMLDGECPQSTAKEAPMARTAHPEIATGGTVPASDLASVANETMLTVDGGASMRP